MKNSEEKLDPEFVRACEAAEAAVGEWWTQALPAALAEGLGVGCRRLGRALLVHANADVLMYNRLLGLGALEPDLDGPLDAALETFRSRGAKRFMVQVAPGPWAEGVVAALEARGYYEHNYWLRLSRDTSSAPEAATSLRIAPLGQEDAHAFGLIDATAFDHPPEYADWTAALVGRKGWHFFGAYDGKDLAGGAAFFLHGEVAWFGFAAIRPEFRRRGAQSALIARRLDAARELGCRWVAVETAADTPEKPNPSTHNLRRMGFRDAYQRPNWVKVLEAQGSAASPRPESRS